MFALLYDLCEVYAMFIPSCHSWTRVAAFAGKEAQVEIY